MQPRPRPAPKRKQLRPQQLSQPPSLRLVQRIPRRRRRPQPQIGRRGIRQTVHPAHHPRQIRQQETGQQVGARRLGSHDLNRARHRLPQRRRQAELRRKLRRRSPQIPPSQRPRHPIRRSRGQDAAEPGLEARLRFSPPRQFRSRPRCQHQSQSPGEAGDGQGIGKGDPPLIQHHRRGQDAALCPARNPVLVNRVAKGAIQRIVG